MTDVPVGKVLDAAFSGRDLSYEIVSPNSIVITKRLTPVHPPPHRETRKPYPVSYSIISETLPSVRLLW